MSNLKNSTSTMVLAGIIAILFLDTAIAAPPIPGTYDPVTMTFYETGLKVPLNYDEPGPMRSKDAYRGVWYFPVLFIETPDFSHTYSVGEWSEQLFTIDTHETGSMRDYYREISYGNFDVDGVALGWIMADNNYSHYHQNNYGFGGGAAELAREAVLKAEALYNPDWSQFDNDGDGLVDGVVIIHMGQGGEGGNPNQIWSHVSSFDPIELDGVKISRYSIQPETRLGNQMETIGTLCHEHGHVLGLPDLYDIDYTSKPDPVGYYCLMASGSSGGKPMGSRPAHLSAWCKSELGWITPTVLTDPGNFTIDAIQTYETNNTYKIEIPNSPNEYFLLANRWMGASLKFEAIPARFLGGLLIYHVDNNIKGSNTGTSDFWRVKIVDAGSNTPRDLADAGFSTDTKTTFGRFTDPNTNGNYHPSGITVDNVSARGEHMSFSVNFEPVLMLKEYQINPLGNKRFSLNVTLENITDITTEDLDLIIATSATNVQFETAQASLGVIGPKKSATSTAFIFKTTDDVTSFQTFTVKARSSGYEGNNISFTIPVNPARILIVDDDHTKGKDYNVELFWMDALDKIPVEYQVWKVRDRNLPFLTMIELYDVVIWCDGIAQNTTPKAGSSLDLIAHFLDRGGDLIWSSQEFLYSQYKYPAYRVTKPGEFVREYLHILEFEQDEYFYDGFGVPGTITKGLHLRLKDVYSKDPDAYSTSDFDWWPDEFLTDDTCIPILTAGDREYPPGAPDDWKTEEDILKNATCAMLYQGQYRLMFMSAGLHGISLDQADHPNTRQEFLRRLLVWFGIIDDDEYPLGVRLEMPDMAHPGDEFFVTGYLDNPGAPLTNVATFFILEVYGNFWFWPSWVYFDYPDHPDIDFSFVDVPTGTTSITVIPEFTWPDTGQDIVTGLGFFGAMLNPEMNDTMGGFAFKQWGYGPKN